MLEIYADESSDEKQADVYAIAGLLGEESQWDELEARWKDLFGTKTFHAADLESDPPREETSEGLSPEECKALMRGAVDILVNGRLLGYAAVLDIRDFWRVFPNVHKDSPYFFCFQEVLLELAETSGVIIPCSAVNFTFDRRPQNEYTATALFEKFSRVVGGKRALATRQDQLRGQEKRSGA